MTAPSGGEPLFVSPAELLRRGALRPKKSWGQNFLHDRATVRRIVDAAQISAADTVVEIGAGLGALTATLAQQANHVVAIERDRELATLLRECLSSHPSISLIEANALTYDFSHFDSPVVVVGNLPYNISSPLLFHLLDQRQHIRSATVMLQRELAQRIASPPGSRLYGVPSVLLQMHAEVRTCLQVGRGAFLPPPRVDSTVIQLVFLPEPRCQTDAALFDRVVRAAFAGRRKTLLRALRAVFERHQLEAAFATAAIDPRARAETLSVEQFAQLAQALSTMI